MIMTASGRWPHIVEVGRCGAPLVARCATLFMGVGMIG